METWSDVDWDLWYSELVWMFLKNKEGIPDANHCVWHHGAGYGPAQAYYKLSAKHTAQAQGGDVSDWPSPSPTDA